MPVLVYKQLETAMLGQRLNQSSCGPRLVCVCDMLKRPAAAQAVVLKRPAAARAGVPKRSAASVQDNGNTAETELCQLPLQWESGSDPKAQVQIVLVTAAKLVNDREDSADAAKDNDDLPPLVDPASVSKADLCKAIQDSVQNPIYDRSRGGRPPSQ